MQTILSDLQREKKKQGNSTAKELVPVIGGLEDMMGRRRHGVNGEKM